MNLHEIKGCPSLSLPRIDSIELEGILEERWELDYMEITEEGYNYQMLGHPEMLHESMQPYCELKLRGMSLDTDLAYDEDFAAASVKLSSFKTLIVSLKSEAFSPLKQS